MFEFLNFGKGKKDKEAFPPLTEESSEQKEEIKSEEPKMERKPKTLQDIDSAKKNIWELQDKREGKLSEIRRQKELLKDLGVNEFTVEKGKRTNKRTETFKDTMSPLEQELEDISNEITQIREDHDLQPSRKQVLESRIKRLEDLKKFENERFVKTVVGANIKSMEERISEFNEIKKEAHENNNQDAVNKAIGEIDALKSKINNVYLNDKEAYMYATTIEKINSLIVDESGLLRESKDPEKDENGYLTVGKRPR